ncbi:uncharacterized protein LOC135311793 [Phalacrocorax carbo]|uniref:uncharacterized protein LOC135311793 n=1 Tax=Phalacrocorax carbo TaxID=9209 RepID=UPI00311A70BE
MRFPVTRAGRSLRVGHAEGRRGSARLLAGGTLCSPLDGGFQRPVQVVKILGYHQNHSAVFTTQRSVLLHEQSPTDSGWENAIPEIQPEEIPHGQGSSHSVTKILLVPALSRLLIVLDSHTSSVVVPNHPYKPDPSPVRSKAQQPRRPPAALRGFIGLCSSSVCWTPLPPCWESSSHTLALLAPGLHQLSIQEADAAMLTFGSLQKLHLTDDHP